MCIIIDHNSVRCEMHCLRLPFFTLCEAWFISITKHASASSSAAPWIPRRASALSRPRQPRRTGARPARSSRGPRRRAGRAGTARRGAPSCGSSSPSARGFRKVEYLQTLHFPWQLVSNNRHTLLVTKLRAHISTTKHHKIHFNMA